MGVGDLVPSVAVPGRADATDVQWARLVPLLSLGRKAGRSQTWTKRQLIDGVRWRVRAGTTGQDVPARYERWHGGRVVPVLAVGGGVGAAPECRCDAGTATLRVRMPPSCSCRLPVVGVCADDRWSGVWGLVGFRCATTAGDRARRRLRVRGRRVPVSSAVR
ncbi:transposase [Rhodococcus sp. WB9]|uniref:transposase n=1 Tax=Rhodococcus sp. WB9 TaxID=2594007 RepID=UPI001185BF21|nr:transposase [Rhodococcus sp. WB9]